MKEENILFCNWYNSLLKFERVYFLKLICIRCEVKPITVYKWVKGDTNIRRAYQEIINDIANKELFSLQPITTIINGKSLKRM